MCVHLCVQMCTCAWVEGNWLHNIKQVHTHIYTHIHTYTHYMYHIPDVMVTHVCVLCVCVCLCVYCVCVLCVTVCNSVY